MDDSAPTHPLTPMLQPATAWWHQHRSDPAAVDGQRSWWSKLLDCLGDLDWDFDGD